MKLNNNLAFDMTEKGLLPDVFVRKGIKHLLSDRLKEIDSDNVEKMAELTQQFVSHMNLSAVALVPEKANEQHYEVPAEFFKVVLGPHLKYSCAYWDSTTKDLHQAEQLGLQLTCEHAELTDGINILELGCGWGALTLWMAEHYPASQITAVSNSLSQGEFIRSQAEAKSLENIHVITADMNEFDTSDRFDRVVSVEMFEHMRNYQLLYQRVSHWLNPDGKFFKHIFVHQSVPYAFVEKDASDWMSRHFFSGGMMPSDELPLFFQDDLKLDKRWRWNGSHYEKTSNAWLARMDANKERLWPLFETTYGKDFASLWWSRWRIFFMACAELFGYHNGQEWFVSHYLFSKR